MQNLPQNPKQVKLPALKPRLFIVAAIPISVIIPVVLISSSQCRPLNIDIQFFGVKTQLYLGDCDRTNYMK